MSDLEERAARVRTVLSDYVARGEIPGAVVLVADREQVRIIPVGALGTEPGDGPMTEETIVRIASLTKPITAAAAMQLVDDGQLSLNSVVAEWVPELAGGQVVRTPASPLNDLVPLQRPIVVEDLLTSRGGWGFPADFAVPAVQALFSVQRDGRFPHAFPPAPDWLSELVAVPMVAQPGSEFLYDTSLTMLGILIERVTGRRLGEQLAGRMFAPLGMTDSSFVLRPDDLSRFARLYQVNDGALVEADSRSTWITAPELELGNGGLLGTVKDLWRFARMLLADGVGPNGRVLSAESVAAMRTNHLTDRQRQAAHLFLDGQGWGYGGSVDVVADRPWTVPGRFGWMGGTGTSAHIVPSTGQATVVLSQVAVSGPGVLPFYRDVWTAAA